MSKSSKNKTKLNDVVDVVADFGLSTSGTAVSNLAALQAAVTACPSNGTIVVPGGAYPIASSSTGILINKRITIEFGAALFVHDGVTTGKIFSILKNGSTPTGDCNFNGQLEGISIRNLTLHGAAIPNGLTDNRTSVCDAIVLDGGTDYIHTENIVIEGFKGAGIKFSGSGSVRESFFDNTTIRYCGNASNSTAALHVINVQTGADAHNEIFFDGLRIVYSLWRDIHVTANSVSPSGSWPRLWYFDKYQIENDTAVSPFWNTPPNCEKVWIEGSGGDFSFTDGNSLNSYCTSNTLWGQPHFRLGNASTGSQCNRTSFHGADQQNSDSNGGVGIVCENALVVKVNSSTFQFSTSTQSRPIVIGVASPSANYGTALAPTVATSLFLGNDNDYSAPAPWLLTQAYLASVTGKIAYQDANGTQTAAEQMSGGYISGGTTLTVPNGGNTNSLNMITFLSQAGYAPNDVQLTNWIINITAYNGSPVVQSSASCLVSCIDANTVANVFPMGSASYAASGAFGITFQTKSNATAGTLSAGNGNIVDIVSTNSTGATITLHVSATRLGGFR